MLNEVLTRTGQLKRAPTLLLVDQNNSYIIDVGKRGPAQQQVAGELGITKARVSQIEHGQVDRAAIRGLADYVAALGGRLELVADFGDERIVIG